LIEAPGELGPWLGWLATLPLTQVRIEPLGLRAVYDQHHNLNGLNGSMLAAVEAVK
jgi:ABC-2 type transport system ATP-binding protein